MAAKQRKDADTGEEFDRLLENVFASFPEERSHFEAAVRETIALMKAKSAEEVEAARRIARNARIHQILHSLRQAPPEK